MKTIERTDLVAAVLASRDEIDPDLETELLEAIVDAEWGSGGDSDAAMAVIDAALTAAIDRGVGNVQGRKCPCHDPRHHRRQRTESGGRSLMLTLLSIEVEGFGPFADRALLTFPDTRGVTVVYGDNMRGKTSLMNAIRYAFFGQVQGRAGRSRGILSACNRDLVASGIFGFTVGLSLRYEGTEFELMRQVTPKVSVPAGDEDFTTTVSLRRAGVVLGPSERAALLRAMLPNDVARFFLFDGELLDQYAELLVSESDAGRVISEAIEHILGVPVLRDARNHLTSLASDASRASAREASKHQKTEGDGHRPPERQRHERKPTRRNGTAKPPS